MQPKIHPVTFLPSSLVPSSASSAYSERSYKTCVSSCPTLARLWASDQNPGDVAPSPTKIAFSHILLGAILLWENGSVTIGHYIHRAFFSPFAIEIAPLFKVPWT